MSWKGESRRHSLARRGVRTVIDDRRRLPVNRYVARGEDRYTPRYLEKWEPAPNYAGKDYSDYYVVYSVNRDSNLLVQSNFDFLKEQLKDMDGVEIATFRHWGVGWIETILIHEDSADALMKADHLMKEYAQYPVFDEEDLWERERDATIDNIKFEGSLDERTAIDVYRHLSDFEPEAIEGHDSNGGWVDEDRIKRALVEMKLIDRGLKDREKIDYVIGKMNKDEIEDVADGDKTIDELLKAKHLNPSQLASASGINRPPNRQNLGNIEVIEFEGQNNLDLIIQRLNKKFQEIKSRNPMGYLDQFGLQYHSIAYNIAKEMGASLDIDDEGNLVFNFTGGR